MMRALLAVLAVLALSGEFVHAGPDVLSYVPLPLGRWDVRYSAMFAAWAYRDMRGVVFNIHSAEGALPRPNGLFGMYRLRMDIRVQDMVFGMCKMFVHWPPPSPIHLAPTSTC